MDRKDFLVKAGLSAAGIFAISNLVSCTKTNPGVNGGAVDFTIDLTNSSFAALNSNGGYAYSNGVIIARTSNGNYIAVSQACTHQGVTVQYEPGKNDFYCSAHGSSFSSTGVVTGGPARGNLRQYNVDVSGNTLHIYS